MLRVGSPPPNWDPGAESQYLGGGSVWPPGISGRGGGEPSCKYCSFLVSVSCFCAGPGARDGPSDPWESSEPWQAEVIHAPRRCPTPRAGGACVSGRGWFEKERMNEWVWPCWQQTALLGHWIRATTAGQPSPPVSSMGAAREEGGRVLSRGAASRCQPRVRDRGLLTSKLLFPAAPSPDQEGRNQPQHENQAQDAPQDGPEQPPGGGRCRCACRQDPSQRSASPHSRQIPLPLGRSFRPVPHSQPRQKSLCGRAGHDAQSMHLSRSVLQALP